MGVGVLDEDGLTIRGWGRGETVSNVLKGDRMGKKGGETKKGGSMLGKGVDGLLRGGCDSLRKYGAHFRLCLTLKIEITWNKLK